MTRARLHTLREGDGAPLFIVPGAGGAATELEAMAVALPGDGAVFGFNLTETPDVAGLSVSELAEACLEALGEARPGGPVCLLGYSLGGLVALDMAERLRDEGRDVAFLGLVDALYDRRHWPTRILLTASARRVMAHLADAARRPSAEAVRDLWARGRKLALRLRRRGVEAERAVDPAAPRHGLFAALGTWTPRPIPTRVWFFSATRWRDFGCDLKTLWRPWAEDLRVRRIEGDHLSLVRDAAPVAALAAAVGTAMAESLAERPRVLLCAAFNWLASARLGSSLSQAGFAVEAACRPRHPLRKMAWLEAAHPVDPWRPEASFAHAIRAARPDLIVPCDDRSAQALHDLHARSDAGGAAGAVLRRRIADSLGDPRSYPVLYSRAGFLALAHEAGAPAPPSARIHSGDDLRPWLAAGPAVLKTDGSHGGGGVLMLARNADPEQAVRRLRNAPGLTRLLKRALFDGDVFGLQARLRGISPKLSVQAFVEGRAANAAVACRDGLTLGMVVAEVERSATPTGPATVVRVVRHAGIERTVATLVERLGLSGLCGFDFMLQADGTAQLLEINPRATPTAHLHGADGSRLAEELAAAYGHRLRRRPARAYAAAEETLIALFPQELRRDPDSPYLSTARHDVPWDEPQLVELGLAQPRGLWAVKPRPALRRPPPPDPAGETAFRERVAARAQSGS